MALSETEKVALYATMVALMRANRTATTFSTQAQMWPIVSASLLRDHGITISSAACRSMYDYREFRRRHPHSQDLRAHLRLVSRMNGAEPMEGDAAGDSRRSQEEYEAKHALDFAAARAAADRGDESASSSSAAPVPTGWAGSLLGSLPAPTSGPSALPLFAPVAPGPAAPAAAAPAAFDVSERPKQQK